MLRLVVLDEDAGAAVSLGVDLGGEERGAIAHASSLLHVVRHDDDRVALLDLLHQLLDASRRDRVERRAGLVHENRLWLDGDRAGDAQALLLTTRHAERGVLEAVLDLVPERRAPQALLDDVVELALLLDAVHPRTERDVVVDALRERVRLLEHHADVTAHLARRHARRVQVGAVVADRTDDPGAGDEVVHAVEAPQDRRLTAPRRPDERSDLALAHVERDLPHRAKRAVVHLEVVDFERPWAGRRPPAPARSL